MPTPLFRNQNEEFTLLNQHSSISATIWDQSLTAKPEEQAVCHQRFYELRFLLEVYLRSEISARGTLPHLISISWLPKHLIIFFSVHQAITLQFMAIYCGASRFFLPPFIPKKLLVVIETPLPKRSVSLEVLI